MRLQIIIVLVMIAGQAFSVADEPSQELPPAAKTKPDFAKDIQPIFAKHCYACHGSQKQESGLRLDVRANALEGGDSGPPFVAGKSADSDLVFRISGMDEDLTMPPEGARLTKEEVGLIRAWIDRGADWPKTADATGTGVISKHWAFQPIGRPKVPNVKHEKWVRNPIDAFVLRKLEESGIDPSPEADRYTLVRRLCLDLLGLPPSLQQVEEFVNDDQAGAYDRLVTRLLKSPHFGERWARRWLDLARYADSDGYEKDRPRPHAWRYRNWVINAINQDIPFDQFTVEQLAGDLLPNATLEQKVATGFHRNTLTNREGGVDQEEYRVKAIVDRVNTTGTVWMGLTIQCCQCHSHKYDPLTQKEFYKMFAFFNNADEADISAPLPQEFAKYEQAKAVFDRKHEQLEKAVTDFEPQLADRQAAWESRICASGEIQGWDVLDPGSYASDGGASFSKLDDGSLLLTDFLPEKDIYTIVVNTRLKGITGFRLEVLPDSKLPKKGPGRAKNGNFVVSEFSVKSAPLGDPTKAEPVALANATADFNQKSFPVATAIDGKAKANNGWAIGTSGDDLNQKRTANFETKKSIGFDEGTTLTFTVQQLHGTQHVLGRFRLSATNADRKKFGSLLPDDVITILAVAADKRSEKQRGALAAYYRSIDPEMRRRTNAVSEHAKKAPAKPATKAQTLAERTKDPRTTHLMIRGDFLRPGVAVEPGTPAVLHALKQTDNPSRLDLARWIVDPANPLTARVAVNRMWLRLFGRGIVASVDDFGTRADPPTHPKLLDWLASEYPRRGWSTKAMIKLIVSSATYRQSSHTRSELEQRDPYNKLLARQNRLRVEAEVVRDLQLACSGLLQCEIGGPSVRPQLPSGVAMLGYANSVKWQTSKGPDRYRRGLYIFFQRTVPYPMLMTFDAPDGNVTCTRRERSNTPLQSLTLLNDPVFFECAQALGRRIFNASGGELRNQLRDAFELCISRPPNEFEVDRLEELYKEQLKLCTNDVEAAANLVGTPKPADEDLPALAAWVHVGRVLMNLDEFMTRE